MPNIEGINIEHLGHDSFKIMNGSTAIYIDPFKVSSGKADLILITHDHYDHCDAASIEKLRSKDTVVIGPEAVSRKIAGTRTIKENGKFSEKGLAIEAVHAYNTNKPFHPKGAGVGYVIAVNNKRIYHTGDTDRIHEMKKLGDIDIALLPVSGTYVMTAEEAAAAANEDIKPKVAIPMHYGSIIGSRADAERFAKLCKSKVVII